MSFPRYPEYRDSGVEWLGEVPAHWEGTSIKRLCETITDGAHISPEREGGEFPFVSTKDIGDDGIDFENCFQTSPASYDYMVKTGCKPQPGDVLFSKDGTIGRTLVVGEGRDFVVASSLIIIRPKKLELDSRFLSHLSQSDPVRSQVEAAVKGAGLPRLSITSLLKVVGCFPPLIEQIAIADFLDRETAKIDALVAEQQRLMELLKEKRQAVISHAVTKGINRDAPLKPSGAKWLGDIPAHWELIQSRRLFRVRNEPARETDQQLTASQKHGMILQSEFMELEGRRVVQIIIGTDSLRHAEPNDFVISLRSFQGGLEWCKISGSITFHYVVLVPIKHVYEPFFAHLFKSIAYIQALRSTTNLIRDGQDLRFSHFTQVDLPIVPMGEQAEIASYLDRETAKFDELITEAQRAIALLQERRTALISAAVTGQIDVRKEVV